MSNHRSLPCTLIVLCLLAFLWPAASMGFKVKEALSPLDDLVFARPLLRVTETPANSLLSPVPLPNAQAIQSMLAELGPLWSATIDLRTGRPTLLEGGAIPWIPGPANTLAWKSLGSGCRQNSCIPVGTVEALARQFMARYPDVFLLDGLDLVLDPDGSGPVWDSIYFLRFQPYFKGVKLEGASIYFRINNGNLIQVSVSHVGKVASDAVPTVTLQGAWDILYGHIGGLGEDVMVDKGELKYVPVTPKGLDPEVFNGQVGGMLDHELVWRLAFQRKGVTGLWEGLVDAHTGELLAFRDTYRYGHIHGGIRPSDGLPPEENRPFPWCDTGLPAPNNYSDNAGNFPGNNATSTLTGKYSHLQDDCGAISNTTASGDLDFLTDLAAGTDCAVPAGNTGGPGNTHSSRTLYYNTTAINLKAQIYNPTNSWLTSNFITCHVNQPAWCNATSGGGVVNFYKAAAGCNNLGEIPGVAMHEWAHSYDTNDGSGGQAPPLETYADFTAIIQTHNSCTGAGFLTSGNCGGYGNPCTACTGIRDCDYAKHNPATPWTSALNGSLYNCSAGGYNGPCGWEDHCESGISTQAVWDFVYRDLPTECGMDITTGWMLEDRLWFTGVQTLDSMYTCSGGVTSGCTGDVLYTVMRALDDDGDGTALGTPHAHAIFHALNRHLLACGADGDATNQNQTSCPSLTTPALSGAGGNNQIALNWTTGGANATRYFVYRNEASCDVAFTRIAVVNAPTLTYTDYGVVNGTTYYYRVQAATASDSCVSPSSNCITVVPVPCETPGAPSGLAANPAGDNQISLSWTNGTPAGVTFNVYRALGACPGSGYARIATGLTAATYTDIGVSGQVTYAYVVTSVDVTGQCESIYSNCDDAITTGPCTQGPTFAGLQSVTNPGNATCTLNLSWNAGTASCGGPLQYKIYRSTTPGFPPGPANLIASVSTTTHSDLNVLTGGTTYYYVVRATDTANGMEETNLVQKSGTPSGPQTTWTDDAGDSGTAKMVPTSNCGGPISWTVSHLYNHTGGGTHAYRSVQAADADNAAGINPDVDCSSILSPPIATATGPQISFWTQYALEPNWDGVVLETRICGEPACSTGTWQAITNAQLNPDYPGTLSNTDTSTCTPEGLCGDIYPYPSGNGTTYINDCDYPPTMQAFTGTNAAWTQYTATLPASYDNVTMQFRFNLSTDCLTGATGAYIDDITVVSGGPCTPGSGCPNNPTVDLTPTGPLTLCTGAAQLLATALTGGTAPFTYQWTIDGSPIPGANSDTYSASGTGTHTYNCNVRGSGCTDDMYDPSGVQITWQSTPIFAGLVSVTDPAGATCTLDLAWTAASSPCPGGITYSIYRSTTSPVPTLPANRIASGVSATAYSDSVGLVNGTTYYYVVHAVAVSTGGEDANTVERSGAPTGPMTTGTWTDDGGDTGTAKLTVQSTWSNAPTGGHSGPKCYATGTYGPSVCISATTPVLNIAAGGGTLTFWSSCYLEPSWDKGQVEISTNGGGTWSRLAVTTYPGTSTNTSDACGMPTGTYFTGSYLTYASYTATIPAGANIKIRWRLSSDGSVQYTGWWIDDISITNVNVPGTCTTGGGCTAPGAPTLNSATGTCSAVDLAWTAGTGTTLSYNVYRAAGACGGAYAKIAGPITTTTYSDASAVAGTQYAYIIRGACDATGATESVNSNCLTGTRLAVPAAPAGVTATSNRCADVQVTWNTVTGATSYNVLRGTACGTVLNTFTGVTSPYNDTSAVAGTNYQYWVVALNTCGTGASSSCAAGVRPAVPAAPAAPTFLGVTQTTLTVNWTAASGATTYDVWRAAGGTCTGMVKITATPISATTYPDSGLTCATQYSYLITANNSCGTSSNGGCASVTTSACTSAPPPVNHMGSGAARFTKGAGQTLNVAYDAATCTANMAVILYGNLGSWAGYAGCAQGNAGNSGSATIDSTLQNNVWYNIVWTSGTTAGHPGFGTSGARTWAAGTLCGMTADDHSHSTCP